jgi:glucokinase
MNRVIPVLEIGGTHVGAGLVDVEGGSVIQAGRQRGSVDAGADREALFDAFAAPATQLDVAEPDVWGVAIPGPFDYVRGIAWFREVGKFDRLHGADVRAGLKERLRGSFVFINDAEAFGLGEWAAGAARGCERAMALTIGTGVGSAFIADGTPLREGHGLPGDGWMHRLVHCGRPLEDVVSRRAIIAAYGDEALDVEDVAARAIGGDQRANTVMSAAMFALGESLAPSIEQFGASVLVVGGGIARSWELIEPPLQEGLQAGGLVRKLSVVRAAEPETAALIGAALYAADRSLASEALG